MGFGVRLGWKRCMSMGRDQREGGQSAKEIEHTFKVEGTCIIGGAVSTHELFTWHYSVVSIQRRVFFIAYAQNLTRIREKNHNSGWDGSLIPRKGVWEFL